jgi:hypothetical protein
MVESLNMFLRCRERVVSNMSVSSSGEFGGAAATISQLSQDDLVSAQELANQIAHRDLTNSELELLQIAVNEVDRHEGSAHSTARGKLLRCAVGLVMKIAELRAETSSENWEAMLYVHNWTSSANPPFFRLRNKPGNAKHRSYKKLAEATIDPMYRKLLAAQVILDPSIALLYHYGFPKNTKSTVEYRNNAAQGVHPGSRKPCGLLPLASLRVRFQHAAAVIHIIVY